MLRLLHALALGLVGAGIVHVAVLLMLPGYSVRDAWSRISPSADPYNPLRLDAEILASSASNANPFIEAAACRFDLADGMLHVRAEGTVPFWSMSIYDRNGLNHFSISDRVASDRTLDFLVLDPEQALQMRGQPPDGFERSIFVEADVGEGIVLVRVFVPDETWEGVTDAFLESLRCSPGEAE